MCVLMSLVSIRAVGCWCHALNPLCDSPIVRGRGLRPRGTSTADIRTPTWGRYGVTAGPSALCSGGERADGERGNPSPSPRRQIMATTQRGPQSKRPAFAELTWATLAAEPAAEPLGFDPTTLRGLPSPAQRFLARALPAGVRLSSRVELDMEGEIKLGGRWFGFTAEQILRAGVGFVWAPVVGGRLWRFVGADALASTPHSPPCGPGVTRRRGMPRSSRPNCAATGTSVRSPPRSRRPSKNSRQ